MRILTTTRLSVTQNETLLSEKKSLGFHNLDEVIDFHREQGRAYRAAMRFIKKNHKRLYNHLRLRAITQER